MKTSLTDELIREVYPIDEHEECYVAIQKETGRVTSIICKTLAVGATLATACV